MATVELQLRRPGRQRRLQLRLAQHERDAAERRLAQHVVLGGRGWKQLEQCRRGARERALLEADAALLDVQRVRV